MSGLEIIGTVSMVMAVVGVLANNRRLRWCFLLWMVSNVLSGVIHAYSGIWGLLVRDVIFSILAVEGWWKWGKKGVRKRNVKKDYRKCDYCRHFISDPTADTPDWELTGKGECNVRVPGRSDRGRGIPWTWPRVRVGDYCPAFDPVERAPSE